MEEDCGHHKVMEEIGKKYPEYIYKKKDRLLGSVSEKIQKTSINYPIYIHHMI